MSDRPHIVLTRQREANAPWREQLRELGLPVTVVPVLRFRPLPPPDLARAAWDWILFTSPQGVRAFLAAGLSTGTARLAALGGGTAAELAATVRPADLPAGATGAELAGIFLTAVDAPAHVLLPGPVRRLPEPAAALRAAGHEVTELPLYETLPVPAAELPARPCRPDDVVFFCSPSAARAFADTWRDRPRCVAIGETTAAVTRAAGFPTRVAVTPDLAAMIAAADLTPRTATFDPESES